MKTDGKNRNEKCYSVDSFPSRREAIFNRLLICDCILGDHDYQAGIQVRAHGRKNANDANRKRE